MNLFIPAGLNSEHFEVKGATIKALAFFAEFLPDEIIVYHEVIMPALLKNFADLNPKISEKALIAIDLFCDNL
jgi:hypothetical protein